MNYPPYQKRQQGLTLVEIMVAITISLILLAGVVQIFVGNKQSYRLTEELSRMQENGRFAMDHIAREIRMAAFWGCTNISVDPNITITNNLNPPNPPTTPANHPVDPSTSGVDGTDNSGLNDSDTLILQGAYGEGLGIETHNVSAASFNVTTVNHGLNERDVVIATDCRKADVFEITNANSGTNNTIVANLGNNDPGFGNATIPGLEYNDSGTIYRIKSVTYAIQTGASGEPALFRNENGNNVELVEGVQDMQILFGVDSDPTDNNQIATIYQSASSVTNMNDVVSVRITLTLSTLNDLHRSDGTFGRITRTYTSTTSIRNRLI